MTARAPKTKWELVKATLFINGDLESNSFVDNNKCSSPWYNSRLKIRAVKVAEGVTKIPAGSFYGCTNVKKISLPSTLQEIGAQCFHNCSSVTNLDIPDNVGKIGDYCFTYMTSLKKIKFPCNKKLKIGICLFDTVENPNIVEIDVIDELIKQITVNTIGRNALITFQKNSDLENAEWTLKEGELVISQVKTDASFVKNNVCTAPWHPYRLGIHKVSIKESLDKIPDGCFYECFYLKEITLPVSITKIGKQAFHACSSIKLITIPKNVAEIGDFCFTYCSNLTEIKFLSKKPPKLGKNILQASKAGIINLSTAGWGNTEIFTDETVGKDTKITFRAMGQTFTYGWMLEGGCLQIYSIGSNWVRIPDMVRNNKPFAPWHKYRNGIHVAIISGKIKEIGSGLFYDCYNLTKISIRSSIESIGFQTFHNCRSVKKIFLPATIKDVGDYAFTYCTSLKTITIVSNDVISFGHKLFEGISSTNIITLRLIDSKKMYMDEQDLNKVIIEELE